MRADVAEATDCDCGSENVSENCRSPSDCVCCCNCGSKRKEEDEEDIQPDSPVNTPRKKTYTITHIVTDLTVCEGNGI